MASLPTLKSRKLIQVDTENDSGEHDISVVTYNILADFYLQPALSRGRYKNCPQEFVTPNQDRHCPRHKLLLTEVRNRLRPRTTPLPPASCQVALTVCCTNLFPWGGTHGCREVLWELHKMILVSAQTQTAWSRVQGSIIRPVYRPPINYEKY